MTESSKNKESESVTEKALVSRVIDTDERLILVGKGSPVPKQAQLPFLMRRLPFYTGYYDYLKAAPWRRLAQAQPIVQNCIVALASQAIALKWSITTRERGREDDYREEIEYYADILNNFNHEDYDTGIARVIYDTLTIPFGGAIEIVRYDDGKPFEVLNIDGGTLRPTQAYGTDFPYLQSIPWDPLKIVVFRRDEIGRVMLHPRPEIDKQGWGVAPLEKAYLAVQALSLGDTYYLSLLTDTPEAGILDLMNMSKEDAIEWGHSWRELLTGIEPMKIPVLYGHDKVAKFIPFSRSPVDLMYDEVLKRYTQIVTACFGIYISDIGLYEERQTLAGVIRTERRARRQGLGALIAKIKNMWDKLLPSHLQWTTEDVDPEDIRSRAAAKVAISNALRILRDAGAFSQGEIRKQAIQDGIITVKVDEELPPELEGMPLGPRLTRPGTPYGGERELRAPSVGGRGGPGSLRLQSMAARSFKKKLEQAMDFSPPEQIIKRMVEEALKVLYPVIYRAAVAEKAEVYERWLNELILLHEGEDSLLEKQDAEEDREKIRALIEEELAKDDWWEIDITELIVLAALAAAFTETSVQMVEEIQKALFEEGIVEAPEIVWDFELTDALTLSELKYHAGQMIQNVNEGTKFFIRRALYRGVKEGLSQARIRDLIAGGENVEAVLADEAILRAMTESVIRDLKELSGPRIDRILEFELNRARNLAKVEMMRRIGLTTKAWVHTGPTKEDDPCPVCVENISQGYVPLDFRYKSVFGETLTPLAHPHGHCTIKINRRELSKFTAQPEYWRGN